MGNRSKRAVTTSTAATVAAALAGGGIALASDQGHLPTIHACASNATGALRLAGHCMPGEHPVAWNQAGPPGPMGYPGSPGPSALPAAWTVTSSQPVGLISSGPTAVLTPPSLPGAAAGTSYVLSATVDVHIPATDNGTVSVSCTLGLGAQSYQQTLKNTVSGSQEVEGSISLGLGATITSTQSPSLTCLFNSGSGNETVQRAELTAIQVGVLH